MALSFLSPKVLWSRLWGRGLTKSDVDEAFEKLYKYSTDSSESGSMETDVSRQADVSSISDGEGRQCARDTTPVAGQAEQRARNPSDDGRQSPGGHGSVKDAGKPDVETDLKEKPGDLQTTEAKRAAQEDRKSTGRRSARSER